MDRVVVGAPACIERVLGWLRSDISSSARILARPRTLPKEPSDLLDGALSLPIRLGMVTRGRADGGPLLSIGGK